MSLEPPMLLAPISTDSSSAPTSRIPSPSSATPTFTIMGATSNGTSSSSTSSLAAMLVPTFIAAPNSSVIPTEGSQDLPSPPSTDVEQEPSSPTASNVNQPSASEVDPQILEALRSKDRLYVLKLGELMESLINDRRARVELSPSTSYQRLLVHRCSAYYRLSPENDPASKGIIVLPTLDSRIPARRLCELVPAESTAVQPAFKIMRRSANERRPKSQSQAGSVAGEDGELSDVEPSESGSLGGRSNTTGSSSKKRMTIEERAAAYNEARSRIFMGFEEKEKEKDMSASSSSLSLVSGSASTSAGGGGSSIGDMDESVSSPATESEWSGPSGPISRDKKDVRRSSSRSLRSSAPPFNANGSSSSRGSRAPSPAFTYASLYEPPPVPVYDPSQHISQAPGSGGYLTTQYMYPYMATAQTPNPPYLAYQYYPAYPHPHYPQPHPNLSDPGPNPNGDMYSPAQHVGYGNPYIWPHPNQPPLPPPMQHSQQPTSQPHPSGNHNAAIYSAPYLPPVPYSYPGYYPPQSGQPIAPLPPQHHISQPVYDGSRSMNGLASNGNRNGNGSTNHGRGSRHSSSSVNGGKRTAPPRAAWSYGPGVSMGGYGASGFGSNGGDAVGPRLSSTRRTSGTSSGNRSSAGDEASSTASSSTTSSSSRRTYTSTASSQHPLPPRPDWAVGLKPQPTLHATHGSRHHDHSLTSSRNMSPISPPRSLNGGAPSNTPPRQQSQQMQPPIILQATDFPPLTSLSSAPEKRAPVVAGAWTNSSSTRSIILMPAPSHANSAGSALVHHSNTNANANNGNNNGNGNGNNNNSNGRSEEADRGFERPPPKSPPELFNPKVVRRPVNGTGKANAATADKAEREREKMRGEAVASAILVAQVGTMSLEDRNGADGVLIASNSIKESSALAIST